MTTSSKPISLQTIAEKMVRDADGDIAAAAVKIFDYCQAHDRLARELGMMAARTLAQQVPIQARQQAQAARSAPAPYKFSAGVEAAQRRARMMGQSNQNALLNDKYTIGSICKPLREWHGDEIKTHGEQQIARGKTQVRNGHFLVLVGTAAGPAVIGEKLDEAAVIKMRLEADGMA